MSLFLVVTLLAGAVIHRSVADSRPRSVAKPAHEAWFAPPDVNHVLVDASARARVVDLLTAAAVVSPTCRGLALSSWSLESSEFGLYPNECLLAWSGHPVTTVAQLRAAAKREEDASRVYLHLVSESGYERDLTVEWGSAEAVRKEIATRNKAYFERVVGAPTISRERLLSELRCSGDRCVMKRALFEAVGANPNSVREVRMVPRLVDDSMVGMELLTIRSESLLAHLGFQRGDLIRRLNGRALTGQNEAIEAYRALRGASEVVIELDRDGDVIMRTIVITP